FEVAFTSFDAMADERGDHQPPLLFRVVGCDGGWEFGWREFDDHPVTMLLGFAAPSEWMAVGLSVCGWGANVGPDRPLASVMPPSKHPDRKRVRVTMLISRDGDEAGSVTCEDGMRMAETVGEGWVADCLRRCLGLATPPPSTAVGYWLAGLWLDRIV